MLFAATARDLAILRELFDSRILTAEQLAAIHFIGSREAAKKRLQTLKTVKLIQHRPRQRPYEPQLLFLTRRGFDLLRATGALTDFPSLTWEQMDKRVRVSPATVRHEMDVGDMKAAVHTAARSANLTVREFITWPRLISFRTQRQLAGGFTRSMAVSPDGFIRLVQQRGDERLEHLLFLEVDRSTETLRRIVSRMAGYLAHYQSGNFSKWMGGQADQAAAYPFRVLWLFKSRQRLMHFAAACLAHRPAIRTMPWLAVQEEAITDPLGRVWVCPADCPPQAAEWSPARDDMPRRSLIAEIGSCHNLPQNTSS